MAEVKGYADAPFETLKSLLGQLIASGEELGASIVLNIDGKNVVDIWGGYFDEAKTQPWTKDTITNVWSSTKTISALAVLILVDRGVLDPYAKVSKYWPEFAQNGKENVEVRHFLSHTSGVSGWNDPITMEEIENLSISIPRLEKQAPFWPPGTALGYHAYTMGHLTGELIKRTTGKSMKQFVADEIAGPLGADFQIGAVEEDWPRVSSVIPPPPIPTDFAKMDPNSPTIKTFANPPMDALFALRPEWRRADMGAVNGHGNARSLVRCLSPITLGGTVDGVKLLSSKTIDLIFSEQADGIDVVLGIPLRLGIGFGLTGGGTSQSAPLLPKGRVCFWGGWGGSLILMDLDRKVTLSYVMNKMGAGLFSSAKTELYLKAVYKALGVEEYAKF